MWPKKFSEGWGWELATRGVDGKTNSWEKFVEAWKSVVCMGRTEGLRAAEGGERGSWGMVSTHQTWMPSSPYVSNRNVLVFA